MIGERFGNDKAMIDGKSELMVISTVFLIDGRGLDRWVYRHKEMIVEILMHDKK